MFYLLSIVLRVLRVPVFNVYIQKYIAISPFRGTRENNLKTGVEVREVPFGNKSSYKSTNYKITPLNWTNFVLQMLEKR